MGTLGSTDISAGSDALRGAPSNSAVKFQPRHSFLVRFTHWISALCFIALLVTGGEIVLSHPRFYWGETGNVNTMPLFKIPVPSSRRLVPTGYNYKLPDQNGWSRALHFQTAWLVALTGLLYGIYGIVSGHFRRELVPGKGERSLRAFFASLKSHLKFARPGPEEAHAYNLLQRLSYLFVIFVAFPLVIWSGLALSPTWDAAFPATVNLLGGRQSARTIHFLVTVFLVLFVLVHVLMVWFAGFWIRTRAMITGRAR
ncbi:MAG: cytochrome b/b6 domain-containing protein [Acidobacteria bacterium]|nr:cytochrome b/b6 domain-containing protein [Acidobacteriota bacterium]MBS1866367.1 cytochrome b/b6 domain-containing protein [Acidobacteriota bacterium]